jgi:hypothetical protein
MTTTTITLLEPTGTRHIRVWWKGQVILGFSFESCCFLDKKMVVSVLKGFGYGGLKEEDFEYYPPYKYNDNCDVYLRKYEDNDKIYL